MRRTALAIAVLGLILTGPAFELHAEHGAASQEEAPPNGDIESGKAVAASCAACHGAEGISSMSGMPHLAGQYAPYIVTALTAYKSGTRTGEAMQAVVAGLDDKDMVDVAAYFASLPRFTDSLAGSVGPGEAFVEEDPFAAAKELTAVCVGCHGEDGISDLPGIPGLAGQHAEYFMAAMKAYREGSRADAAMQAFSASLSDGDIEEIAFYYAVVKPTRAETPVAGDPYAGRAPAEACVRCHGEDGNSADPDTPRLAGLDAEYLAAAIEAYKNGSREHAAMQDSVGSVRDSEIANLAAFYATKEPKALPLRKPLTAAEWTERCDRCHGPGGRSVDPRFPILAGQSETYLIDALKLYHSGERPNPLMFAMSFPMSEADIKKLAAHYAHENGE